jgi:ATP-dependent exoDNAse (exonuclease V) alpha subunit
MTSIEGTVLSIVFRNDENGWTVLEIDFNGELTTAVGCLPHIHEGEFVRLFGAWTEHRMYGRQFSVTSVETRLPNTAESIRLFLASGLIKGVGEGLAPALIEILIDTRAQLRAAKQWALADNIRNRLAAAGVQLQDGPEGTTWTLREEADA